MEFFQRFETLWNQFFACFVRISGIMYMSLYILLLNIDFSQIYFYHTSYD